MDIHYHISFGANFLLASVGTISFFFISETLGSSLFYGFLNL